MPFPMVDAVSSIVYYQADIGRKFAAPCVYQLLVIVTYYFLYTLPVLSIDQLDFCMVA